ncbi:MULTISPECIES: hypothetical protein [unclassified Streptomyces]|uniref:hypothetical protein n=1 Tax=unclassified Streptomyces TaxID=2593676 RepID=UPI00131DE202|nr:hypothetical protein [Streptomyces sp. CB01635]
MPSPYAHIKRYYGCRFGRAQLNKLSDMVEDDLPPGSVSFATQFGTSPFRAGSLAALVADVEASPDVAVNRPWDNLTIAVQGPAPDSVCKIEIDSDRTALAVETPTDSTWARGIEARVSEFLTAQAAGRLEQPSPPSAKRLRTSIYGILLWAFALWYSTTVYPGYQEEVVLANGKRALTQASGEAPTSGLIVLSALILWCLSGAVRHFVRMRGDKAALAVTADLPTGNTWHRLSSTDKIATVGAVLAGLAMVGTLVSAGADVLKP